MDLTGRLETFRQYLQKRGLSENSIKSYIAAARKFLTQIEEWPPSEKDVQQFENWLLNNCKPATVNQRVIAVNNFLTYCKVNLSITLKTKNPKSLPQTLPIETIISAIDSVPQKKNRMLLTLLYATGCRIGEMAKLRGTDIKEGFIRINGKGLKQRDVPISKKIQEELLTLTAGNPNVYIFSGSTKPPSERNLYNIVKRSFELIGISNVHPHTIRHCTATHLIEQGESISIVQALLGHESIKTTEKYIHVTNRSLRQRCLRSHPLYAATGSD